MAKKKSTPRPTCRIGVIGGSGLYDMKGIEDIEEVRIKTPFGPPSDTVIIGSLAGERCAFLPRHGRGHRILPSELNGRANIWALKSLGVERILSLGAVGSLREEYAPRHFVFPDQLVDETKRRVSTFFGEGVVAHVAFAEPFCGAVSDLLFETARDIGLTAHSGGTYCCMEGPAFSTKAESEMHRKLGYSVIGMTAIPEAKLAREAEMCYAPVAMITDYDCWKEGEEVSTSTVIEHLVANVENAQKLVAAAIGRLARTPRTCECGKALENSVFTQPHAIDKKTAKKLELLIGKYVQT